MLFKEIELPGHKSSKRIFLNTALGNGNLTTELWGRYILPPRSFVNKNLRDKRFKL